MRHSVTENPRKVWASTPEDITFSTVDPRVPRTQPLGPTEPRTCTVPFDDRWTLAWVACATSWAERCVRCRGPESWVVRGAEES